MNNIPFQLLASFMFSSSKFVLDSEQYSLCRDKEKFLFWCNWRSHLFWDQSSTCARFVQCKVPRFPLAHNYSSRSSIWSWWPPMSVFTQTWRCSSTVFGPMLSTCCCFQYRWGLRPWPESYGRGLKGVRCLTIEHVPLNHWRPLNAQYSCFKILTGIVGPLLWRCENSPSMLPCIHHLWFY